MYWCCCPKNSGVWLMVRYSTYVHMIMNTFTSVYISPCYNISPPTLWEQTRYTAINSSARFTCFSFSPVASLTSHPTHTVVMRLPPPWASLAQYLIFWDSHIIILRLGYNFCPLESVQVATLHVYVSPGWPSKCNRHGAKHSQTALIIHVHVAIDTVAANMKFP